MSSDLLRLYRAGSMMIGFALLLLNNQQENVGSLIKTSITNP